MINESIQRLEYLCKTIPSKLESIGEPAFSEKRSPAKWSKKEIIGHLIDSATNNHHRIIRAQIEHIPTITYDQNKWNELNGYQHQNGQQIIALWTAYNQHILQLIKSLSIEQLSLKVNTGDELSVTLEYLIDDYVIHMEHHLRQVIAY